MDAFFEVVDTLALLLMSLAAAYFFLAAGLGIRELRRQRTRLSFQDSVGFGHPFRVLDDAPAAPRSYHLYFLVPCLDEEAVIARTVSALLDPDFGDDLLGGPWEDSRIIVIDDGSTDATAMAAREAGGEQLLLVQRRAPDARRGKGAALNAGFRHLLDDVAERHLDPDRVIVVVMDADGRLSDGAIHEVLPLFDDPEVGGVQLAVRIRNREDNFLLQFQDHQFWTLSSLTQFGRISTGTVSLGGNGQFTRLRALLDVGETPWSSSLTEDLDLAISLAVAGWRLTSTPRAAVDQQGVARLGPLVRQRTRWYQGHMSGYRRLPEVLSSRRMNHASSVEMSLYLLVPWLFDLPWSVLYHLILLQIALDVSDSFVFASTAWLWLVQLTILYVLGFWPALVTSVLARRRQPTMTLRRAAKLGHCFVATNYLSYLCAWRALWRMARRQHGWTKTVRSAEADEQPIAAGTAPPRVLGAISRSS